MNRTQKQQQLNELREQYKSLLLSEGSETAKAKDLLSRIVKMCNEL